MPYTRPRRARVEAWQGGCCQGHGASELGGVGGGASRARGGVAGGAAVRSRDSCWHLRGVPVLGTKAAIPSLLSAWRSLRERICRPPRRGASCWLAAPPNKSTSSRAYGLPTIHGAPRGWAAAAEPGLPATHPRRQTGMDGRAPPVSTQLLHRVRSSPPPPSQSGSHPSHRRATPNSALMRGVGRPSQGRRVGGKRTAHGASAAHRERVGHGLVCVCDIGGRGRRCSRRLLGGSPRVRPSISCMRE